MTDDEKAALRGALATVSRFVGCGDGGCQFVRPKGMHTNGGCRCKEKLQAPFACAAIAALYRQVEKMVGADA